MSQAKAADEADASSTRTEAGSAKDEKAAATAQPLLIAGDLWLISRAANFAGSSLITWLMMLPSRYFPQWFVVGYILVHTCLAFRSRDSVLRDDYALGPAIRIIHAVAWLPSMFYILRSVRFDLIIPLHHLLTSNIGSAFNTYMDYVRLDGPSFPASQTCILARDSLLIQAIGLLLYTYRSSLGGPASAVFHWFVVPMLSIVLGTWLCSKLGAPGKAITRAMLAFVRVNVMRLCWWQDVWDVVWMTFVQTHDNASYRNLHDLAQRKKELHIDLPLYQYYPLQPGQIRLLVIAPSGYYDGGVFQARLVHTDLSSLPSYEAISYQWGDTKKSDEIIVDYQSFPLGKSAIDVLRSRRRWFKPRTIWLDAICINQADPEEKAAQVQLMKYIYAQAFRVVVFPGFEPELRLVHDLIHEEAATLSRYGFRDSFVNFRPLLANGNFTARWKAWKALLFSDYFGRAWIVQEIAASHDVQLYLHGFYVPWKWFMRAAARFGDPFRMGQLELAGFTDESVSIGGKTVPGVMNSLAYIDALRENDSLELKEGSFATGAHRNLEHLLEFTAGAKATDPRDHIFAITGLATDIDTQHPLLRPDYTKSVAQVFEDAARYLFVDQPVPSLKLIGRAGIGYTRFKRKVPSWVPDWSETRISMPHTQLLIQRTFNACGDRYPALHSTIFSPGILGLEGVFIDKIHDISEVDLIEVDTKPDTRVLALDSLRRKLNFVEANMRFTALHASKMPDFDPTDMYRIFTIDHMEDSPITPNFKNVFEKWVENTRYIAEATGYMDMVKRSDKVTGENIWAPALPLRKGDEHAGKLMNVYNQTFSSSCIGRRVAVSGLGRCCLVPMMAKRGDHIFVPFGSASPFVVRRDLDGEHWQMVGEAYVHGAMYGEALQGDCDPVWLTLR